MLVIFTNPSSSGFSIPRHQSTTRISDPHFLRKSMDSFCGFSIWILFVGGLLLVTQETQASDATVLQQSITPIQLNGRHLDITITVDSVGFIDVSETEDGRATFSGYIIDILEALAPPDRGNFTYTLKTASGQGTLCDNDYPDEPYPRRAWYQYNCAQSDVTDFPHTNYTTDMYVGAYYITPERIALNYFTVPLFPPQTGRPAMFGTATNVQDAYDFLRQQKAGQQGPACLLANTASAWHMKQGFPEMRFVEVHPNALAGGRAFSEGTCDVLFASYSLGSRWISILAKKNLCRHRGKPVGLIGSPVDFGPNHFGFGIRKDLPSEVLETFNYWLVEFMSCSPHGECPTDSLSVLYHGGTGRECGYVQFPNDEGGIRLEWVAVIVIAAVGFGVVISWMVYQYQSTQQAGRFKKRFVQQIARNINIGPSPRCIPVDKLVEEVQHIGNSDGTITKEELLHWMSDVKLEFISDKDFEALWSAMDICNKGEVNAIDFFVFLSACGSEFEKVYQDQLAMPKLERLKLAARRLTNINKLGEMGVRALERQLEGRSNRLVLCGGTKEPRAPRPDLSSNRTLATAPSEALSSRRDPFYDITMRGSTSDDTIDA